MVSVTSDNSATLSLVFAVIWLDPLAIVTQIFDGTLSVVVPDVAVMTTNRVLSTLFSSDPARRHYKLYHLRQRSQHFRVKINVTRMRKSVAVVQSQSHCLGFDLL